MMWLGFLATIRLLIKAIIFSQYTDERERGRWREVHWGRQNKERTINYY